MLPAYIYIRMCRKHPEDLAPKHKPSTFWTRQAKNTVLSGHKCAVSLVFDMYKYLQVISINIYR